MITRNALYTFIESLIASAGVGTPLEGATSFRNVHGSVNAATKVVRVECITGQHCMTTEDRTKELNVQATIQTFCLPATDEEADLDTAIDTSFEMSRTIFRAIADNPQLNNLVCDSYFDDFETGYANLSATRYGVTWLDGLINQAS